MEKINLSTKAKKSLIAVGSGLICVGAVALIVTFSTGAKAPDPVVAASSSMVTSINVEVGDIQANSDNNSQDTAFVPSSGVSQTTQLTKIEKPTSTPPKPAIQGDASTASNGTKTQPTNSALTNKNQKPSYTSKPTTSQSSSKPSNNNQGQADPVFGNKWGTGGQMTQVGGDWGGGSQIGIMD